jgi:hypothetical protein
MRVMKVTLIISKGTHLGMPEESKKTLSVACNFLLFWKPIHPSKGQASLYPPEVFSQSNSGARVQDKFVSDAAGSGRDRNHKGDEENLAYTVIYIGIILRHHLYWNYIAPSLNSFEITKQSCDINIVAIALLTIT